MSALQWMVMRVRPVHRLEFEVLHALTQKDHPAMVPFEIKWERRPGIKHLRPKK